MATAPSRGYFVANCTDKLPGGAGQPRTRDAQPAELTGAVSSAWSGLDSSCPARLYRAALAIFFFLRVGPTASA